MIVYNKPTPQPAPQPERSEADTPASPRPEVNRMKKIRRDSTYCIEN
jgi:hypothetical protein